MKKYTDTIISILKDYITDDRYTQAAMISGDWGTGKTYFVKKKLIPKLKDNYNSIYYLSLYGINDIKQLMEKFYISIFSDIIREKINATPDKAKKISNISLKLLSLGLSIGANYFNIKKEDLPSLSDLYKINNLLLFLDDMERCAIPFKELLGFINELTEHHKLKIILIANKDKLQSETYDLINEKTIGLIIQYKASFQDNFLEVVQSQTTIKEVKKLFFENQKEIIDIFKKYSCYNIRTLIFSIISYEKIFFVINEIIENPSIIRSLQKKRNLNIIKLEPYLFEEEKKILYYLIETAIKIKNNKSNYLKSKNTTSIEKQTEPSNYLEFLSYKLKEYTKYEFVDNFLNNRYLDKKNIQKHVLAKIENNYHYDIKYSKEKFSSFFKLKDWIYLEDEQIYCLLHDLKMELNNNIYSPNNFGYIIQLLISLNEIGFKNINYNDYLKPMKKQMRTISFSPETLRCLQLINFDNVDNQATYNNIIQPLIKIIYNKQYKNIVKQYFPINNAKKWDIEINSYCNNNIKQFLINQAFFYYLDTNNMLNIVLNSSLTEIYLMSSTIYNIYIKNNTYNHLKKDKNNLIAFVEKLNLYHTSLKENTITRKLALNPLIDNLNKIISHM